MGTSATTLPPGAMPPAQPPTHSGGAPTSGPTAASGHPGGGATGSPTGSTSSSDDANAKSIHHENRSKLPFTNAAKVWEEIDKAVEAEMKRTRVGAKFLPVRRVAPKTLTVPSDSYSLPAPPAPQIFAVDEGAVVRVNTISVGLQVTPQQVSQETGDPKNMGQSTTVTLAMRAANALAQAEDLVIFQGQNAVLTASPFTSGLVTLQGSLADSGLLNLPIGGAAAGPLVPAVNEITVAPLAPAVPGVIYGPNTFEGVSQAYAQLQEGGHYGPYALVLETIPYADTFAPLPATLTLTADRIKPLAQAGFFGTGTLPPNPPPAPVAPYYGVMVSLGGNTMDLVVGLDATTAFMQESANGNFLLQVTERFALRLKDTSAVVRLKFT
jgi:uncharacterized linocin/CFP29 family protein